MLEVQALHGDELAAVDTTAAAAAAAVSTGGESSSSAVKEAAADEGDDDGMSEIRIGRVIFNGVGEDAHVDPFLDVVDNYVEEVSARGGLDPGEGLGGEAGGDADWILDFRGGYSRGRVGQGVDGRGEDDGGPWMLVGDRVGRRADDTLDASFVRASVSRSWGLLGTGYSWESGNNKCEPHTC